MFLTELLQNLNLIGARLEVNGENLQIHAPQGSISTDIKSAIQQHKEKLVLLMKQNQNLLNQNRQAMRDDGPYPVPLTVGQRWFFSKPRRNPHRWCFLRLYNVHRYITTSLIEKGVEVFLARHEALRTFYCRENREWYGKIGPADIARYVYETDISVGSQSEHSKEVTSACVGLQEKINVENGPLFAVALLRNSEYGDRLLLMVHHLLSDAASINIVIEDFFSIIIQLIEGIDINLPANSTSVGEIALELERRYRETDYFADDIAYWKDRCWSEMQDLPADFAQTPESNGILTVRRISRCLSEEDTLKVRQILKDNKQLSLTHLFCAAIMNTINRWAPRKCVPVIVSNNGRMAISDLLKIDASRTIGWLAYSYILFLEKGDDSNKPVEELARLSKEINEVPKYGISFDIVTNRIDEDSVKSVDINSNNLIFFQHEAGDSVAGSIGQDSQEDFSQRLFSNASEDVGPYRDENNKIDWNFKCVTSFVEGCLQVQWSYSSDKYRESTMIKLTEGFLGHLKYLAKAYEEA